MTLVVRIRQYQFPLTREYKAGHILTEAEATALNQIFTENIRRNVSSWVRRATPYGHFLTPDEHAELTARIDDYATNYRFNVQLKGKSQSLLAITAKEIARQEAEAWGQRNGFTPESPQVILKTDQLKEDPTILNRARELIRTRSSVVDSTLEDLEDDES